MKPIIGILLGDRTGIGPEVVAKVISKNNLLPYCKPIMIGDFRVIDSTLKKLGLISVENRGANRTCITRVLFNILNNIDLVLYFIDEIKALAGVFGYHITRFIKISYRKILSNVFSSNSRDKNIEVLKKLEHNENR